MTDLPTLVRNLVSRETFYIIGNVVSIASFILSIFVLWNVRKLAMLTNFGFEGLR
jgi:hypothetical protein